MNKTRTLLSVASAAAVALALAGCSAPAAETAPGDGPALVTAGSFTVCTNPSYEPFEFTRGGEIVGFDMDLAAEIAKDLDVKLEIISAPFEGIQSGAALDTAQCDAGITGMSINDTRRQAMDFSEPYYTDGLGLLVPKASGITAVADLGDKPVGVQQATTGEEYAAENGLNALQFEESNMALEGLRTGAVDGVINNLAVITRGAENDDSLHVVAEFDSEEYGIAVRKGNTALLDAVNATIERVNSDGTFDTLIDTWIK